MAENTHPSRELLSGIDNFIVIIIVEIQQHESAVVKLVNRAWGKGTLDLFAVIFVS